MGWKLYAESQEHTEWGGILCLGTLVSGSREGTWQGTAPPSWGRNWMQGPSLSNLSIVLMWPPVWYTWCWAPDRGYGRGYLQTPDTLRAPREEPSGEGWSLVHSAVCGSSCLLAPPLWPVGRERVRTGSWCESLSLLLHSWRGKDSDNPQLASPLCHSTPASGEPSRGKADTLLIPDSGGALAPLADVHALRDCGHYRIILLSDWV